MNIAADIGNTRLKCAVFFPAERRAEGFVFPLLPMEEAVDKNALLRQLLGWKVLPDNDASSGKMVSIGLYPEPITWWMAPTGSFSWKTFQSLILQMRPSDQFKTVTRQLIPLKMDVDSPDHVGIDRLLAALAATKHYGDLPMLIVDAGTAITVDVVQNQTFCGGAILPGLTVQAESYPRISNRLPFIPAPLAFAETESVYPGKNTEDAILAGIYWGTVGAIRQLYEKAFSRRKNTRLILTGGDAVYLLPGLMQVISSQRMECHDMLVLEGVYECFAE